MWLNFTSPYVAISVYKTHLTTNRGKERKGRGSLPHPSQKKKSVKKTLKRKKN